MVNITRTAVSKLPGHIAELDGIRAIAIGMVLILNADPECIRAGPRIRARTRRHSPRAPVAHGPWLVRMFSRRAVASVCALIVGGEPSLRAVFAARGGDVYHWRGSALTGWPQVRCSRSGFVLASRPGGDPFSS